MTALLVVLTAVVVLPKVSATNDPLSPECSQKISDAMFAKGQLVDSKTATALANKDQRTISALNTYHSKKVVVYEGWNIDKANCDVSLYEVNVGYILADSNGKTAKTMIVTLDPALAKVTKVDLQEPRVYGTSSNWSGYEVAGGGSPAPTLTQTQVTYSIPAVSEPTTHNNYHCIPNTSANVNGCDVAPWVGLEGALGGGSQSNPQLAQDGNDGTITCTSVGSCTTSYFLWYEVLPDSAFTCNNASIRSGDFITATVTNAGSSNYNLSVQDSTASYGCSTTNYHDSHMSTPIYAAFINERASTSSGDRELAKFGSDTQTGSITYGGNTYQITSGMVQSTDTMQNTNVNGTWTNINLGSISSSAFSQTWSTSDGT